MGIVPALTDLLRAIVLIRVLERKQGSVETTPLQVVRVNPNYNRSTDCLFFNPNNQSYGIKGSLPFVFAQGDTLDKEGTNQNAVDHEVYSNHSTFGLPYSKCYR